MFIISLTTPRRSSVERHTLAGRLFLICSEQMAEDLQQILSRPKGCDVLACCMELRGASDYVFGRVKPKNFDGEPARGHCRTHRGGLGP